MPENSTPTRQEICKDLASQWLTLSAQVRAHSLHLHSLHIGTPHESESTAFLRDTTLLCDHFERLHGDVQHLLGLLDQQQPAIQETPAPTLDSHQAAQQAIQAYEKEHQENDSLKDVIKALFMWRDHPADINSPDR